VSKRHIIGYEPSGAPIRRDVVAQTSPKGRPIPFIGGGAPGPDEQRLTVIDARLVEIASELEAIEALPEPEGEDAQRSQALSDRATLSDELIAEAEELNTERAPYATRIARRAAVLGQVRELAGAGGPSVTERGDAGGANDHSVQVRTGLRTTTGRIADPYRELDAVRSMRIDAREMVHRARTAIEDGPDYMLDEHKEQADLIVRRASKRQKPLMAQHMLLTGSEPYREMFENYMYSPMDFAQRAALSLTNANGGYLVPFTLDPTVILTNTGSANPYRQISAVKRTATNNWNGVASTGMNAAWLAEAGVVADNSPTFSNIQITRRKRRRGCSVRTRSWRTPTSRRSCRVCSPTRRTGWRRPRSRPVWVPVRASRRASSPPRRPLVTGADTTGGGHRRRRRVRGAGGAAGPVPAQRQRGWLLSRRSTRFAVSSTPPVAPATGRTWARASRSGCWVVASYESTTVAAYTVVCRRHEADRRVRRLQRSSPSSTGSACR
jgi:HK97 family phage major capsid protein